jgi:hypothetical protein
MIKGTVALPTWKSKKITWLCMESLCNQVKPVDGWELIIFEEEHDQQLGEEWFLNYSEPLSKVGCERIHYITSIEWVPLSQKWVLISREATITSEYFCLCATDNYYHSNMLVEFEEAIKTAEWCLSTRGYFYDFYLNKVIKYNHPSIIGLQMGARTNLVQQMPLESLPRGIDGWFFNKLKDIKHNKNEMLKVWISGSDHFEGTLCTNGLNTISVYRNRYFNEPHPPFYETDKKLIDIVPYDVFKRISYLSKSMQPNDDLA